MSHDTTALPEDMHDAGVHAAAEVALISPYINGPDASVCLTLAAEMCNAYSAAWNRRAPAPAAQPAEADVLNKLLTDLAWNAAGQCRAENGHINDALHNGLRKIVAETVDAVQALAAARAVTPTKPAAQAVPEGWRLVPVEPIDEQLEAGDGVAEPAGRRIDGAVIVNWSEVYRAMIDAAPQPPAPVVTAAPGDGWQPIAGVEPVKGAVLPDKVLSGFRAAAENAASHNIAKADPWGFSYRCEICGATAGRPHDIAHTTICFVGDLRKALDETAELWSAQDDAKHTVWAPVAPAPAAKEG